MKVYVVIENGGGDGLIVWGVYKDKGMAERKKARVELHPEFVEVQEVTLR